MKNKQKFQKFYPRVYFKIIKYNSKISNNSNNRNNCNKSKMILNHLALYKLIEKTHFLNNPLKVNIQLC